MAMGWEKAHLFLPDLMHNDRNILRWGGLHTEPCMFSWISCLDDPKVIIGLLEWLSFLKNCNWLKPLFHLKWETSIPEISPKICGGTYISLIITGPNFLFPKSTLLCSIRKCVSILWTLQSSMWKQAKCPVLCDCSINYSLFVAIKSHVEEKD